MQNSKEQKITNEIGAKIKIKRCEIGMSQTVLAKHLKVSFQQLQKYENGQNRISAAKIKILCNIFKVNSGYFYDDNKNIMEESMLVTAQRKFKRCRKIDKFELVKVVNLLLK